MRSTLLEELHIGDQGVNAMKTNALQLFFWPGMNKHLKQVRDNCRRHVQLLPSQRKEPLQYTPMPDYSFQQVVRDLFHMSGMTYFVYADRFSRLD